MNKSVQEQVPDGLGLADVGLVRWVSEVRRSVGPSCREAGAQRLRSAAQARTASQPRGPELPLVQDLRTDHGLAVRLYRPTQDLRPTVLYLHGGGFVMGDIESHDGTCRRLARIADVTVLAVDYRLAPEHPGPAAVEDTVSTFVWARQHLQELGGDPEAGVALAGDSSGGALAVLAAVRLRAGGMTPSALLLAYPNADMTLRGDSVAQEGHGWGT
jgi:acetyl esterase